MTRERSDNARKKKVLIASLKIILPLYITYALFAFFIFVVFIPRLKVNLLEQKKTIIRQLTQSAVSLLSEYDVRILIGELEPEKAKIAAKEQIRMMRYGPEGKDYFWINDIYPFMIMHPYRPDLEGRDLTLFTDSNGNYPFIAMVARVMESQSGYVDYFWQWKDSPQKISPKISYVQLFEPWGWVVGTGFYTEDVNEEIDSIANELVAISILVLMIILGVSLYLTAQTVRSERERLKTIEDLSRREGLMKAIWEANPNPMVFYDHSGHPLYLNPAFTKVFGWTMEELKGIRAPFVPDDQKEQTKEKIKEIYAYGVIASFETKRFTKNGKCLDINISAALNRDEAGNAIGMVVNLEDITEKKALEAQYIRAQKMEAIGTLAGGIAHDFNNILSPILGYSEMVLADLSKGSPFRKSLEAIHASAMRAKDLVRQILSFSRASSKDFNPIELQLVIREAMKLIRATIPTSIEIKQFISHDCGKVKADPTQIHQIVMNLSTNAYHAMMETGGVLHVSLDRIVLGEQEAQMVGVAQGVYAYLKVSDTGMGMEKEVADKIFDPFFSTKEEGKGTGLGLSVVHGIVKSSEGAIRVRSEMGKGTEFQIFFPISEGDSGNRRGEPSTEHLVEGNERILLVDDEKVIIKVISEMLKRMGYGVTAFTDSNEALRSFENKSEEFDLVITDMTMPNLTGDKLAVEIREIRPDLPVILCTGFSDIISESEAIALGIDGFLMKPVVMTTLSQKIREVLTKSEAVT